MFRGRGWAIVSVGPTVERAGADFRVAAGNGQNRIGLQGAPPTSEGAETQPLGVAQQPGRLGVGGGQAVLARGDAEGHPEFLAVAADRFAGGCG